MIRLERRYGCLVKTFGKRSERAYESAMSAIIRLHSGVANGVVHSARFFGTVVPIFFRPYQLGLGLDLIIAPRLASRSDCNALVCTIVLSLSGFWVF